MDLPDELLDQAVNSVRYVIPHPKTCLPSSVLLQRVLDVVAPGHGFVLKVGALHVYEGKDPRRPERRSSFDPRDSPRGENGSIPLDAAFHAWLEHRDGTVLDCAVLPTLMEDGVDTGGDDGYFTNDGRIVVFGAFALEYEPINDIDVVGFAESEPHLERAVRLALMGSAAGYTRDNLGPNVLNIRWRQKAS